MISEWPIRPPAPGEASVAPCVLRTDAPARRLENATADLFLRPDHRISDRVRASASATRDALVAAIERDLRLFLAPRLADRAELGASLASASVAIALPLLADTQALRHPPLVAILLRRAEEFVLAERIRSVAPQRSQPLIDDADPGIASAAMALLIADSRRLDRFGEPLLLADDLPAELAHWLVWQVAAALRHYLCAQHGLSEADADVSVTAAAQAVLAAHDEGRGLYAAAAWLAERLKAAGRIDGTLLATLLSAGKLSAFTAALASAAGLSQDEAWAVLADPAQGGAALLLRAAGVAREEAGTILLLLRGDEEGAARELARFDACDRDAARQAVAPLALLPEYRAALASIDAALAEAAA